MSALSAVGIDLVALAEPAAGALATWWETGSLPDVSVEGYTPARLMQDHGMNPVAALLTLDWLVREPEKAKASLSKGHDFLR